MSDARSMEYWIATRRFASSAAAAARFRPFSSWFWTRRRSDERVSRAVTAFEIRSIASDPTAACALGSPARSATDANLGLLQTLAAAPSGISSRAARLAIQSAFFSSLSRILGADLDQERRQQN
jgi:hypothetical protein